MLDGKKSLEEVADSWPFYNIEDSSTYEEALEEGRSEEEALREALESIESGYFVSDDYFFDGSDLHMEYARDALSLPEWVETYEYDEGGPGTGFTAYCIAVRPPYKFEDLVAWLKEYEAKAKSGGRLNERSS